MNLRTGPSSRSVCIGEGDFTVEAFVQLESIYDDSKVRVIAAEWDGDQKLAGWSFGVTSEKSKYKPRNVVLQLVNAAGEYEVVPSDLQKNMLGDEEHSLNEN